MRISNFSIHYTPKPGAGGHSVEVSVSNEFVEFAKKQKVDHEEYEKRGLEILQAIYGRDFEIGLRIPHICGWVSEEGKKTGLLHHIIVPGNAAGVNLDQSGGDWNYFANNMDHAAQASAVLGILTNYLFEIESKIPEE